MDMTIGQIISQTIKLWHIKLRVISTIKFNLCFFNYKNNL